MEAYALTDIGQIRSMNQDYTYSSLEMVGSLPNLFLVADGMGGRKAGNHVSWFVVESLVIYINRVRKGSSVMQPEMGVKEVNERPYGESLKREELKGMDYTPVVDVVEDGTLYVANAGDSRLYLIQAGAIRQVIRDHSYVEEMATIGQMRRGSADYNSHKNIVARVMGIGRSVEPDLFEVDLEEGDYILLCSDGLSNMADDDTICNIVTGPGSLKERASRLIREANRQGGIDSIAVVPVNPLGGEAGTC